MNIGFNTTLWGFQIGEIQFVLDAIARAGYQGVEFGQRPDALGVGSIDELLHLLEERGLHFIGIFGGTLKERVQFCQETRPTHLFLEHWDLENAAYAVERGFTLALHPNRFTAMRRSVDAIALAEKYPNLDLRIILDTAHMTIAGEDLGDAIRLVGDRLSGLHLKDWTPEFGRFSHRYGNSLKELGQGIVKLEDALNALQDMAFNGWVIGELDRLTSDPFQSFGVCTDWLAHKGLLPSQPLDFLRSSPGQLWPGANSASICPSESEIRFRERILLAGLENRVEFYRRTAMAYKELIPSKLATIWACSPAQDHVGVLCTIPDIPLVEGDMMRFNDGLTGIAIDRQRASTLFNISAPLPAEPYGYSERRFKHNTLRDEMSLGNLLIIPIYDLGNHSRIRLVISLFPEETKIPISDEEIYRFGCATHISADMMLDTQCSFASGRVNAIAGQANSVSGFLDGILLLIEECVNCEGVALFLVNEAGDKLTLAQARGVDQALNEDDEVYRKGEGLLGRIWDRNEPYLAIDSEARDYVQDSRPDGRAGGRNRLAHLLVPFVDTKGKVIGIVRCRNRKIKPSSHAPNMFFEDDLSIVDTIGQAAAPHLQVLLTKERRSRALAKLTHELRTPVAAIRNTADVMMMNKPAIALFDYDYAGDILSWSELMRRLVINADLFRYSSEGLPMQPERILLRADVIAPAVKQVSIYLKERNFSARRIKYGDFRQIPHLWLDRNQFQQVIFNLLANAINHCYDDPRAFQIQIDGTRSGDEYTIIFRDYGPGIESDMRDVIFNEGIRGPLAKERNVNGQGLGLWVVRQVVEAHDGRIKVTSLSLPTEFTIYLPIYLASGPPNRKMGKR